MNPHFTAEDRRLLAAMQIDLGDPRVTLREPDRLETPQERYDNLKREAAIVIGQLSLQRDEARRTLRTATDVALIVVVFAAAFMAWWCIR